MDYRHKILGDSALTGPHTRCRRASTIFFEAEPTKRPAAEAPTLTWRDPDPPLRERHSVRLFPPYGVLVWPLSLCAAVGELFPDRAWLALSFLLVRWCPPFSIGTGVIFVCVRVH